MTSLPDGAEPLNLYVTGEGRERMMQRPLILVIDDNEAVLELLKNALSFEYRVYALVNPFEIVELIQNIKPDLVLTDLGLPVYSGVDVIQAIRRCPEFDRIPILVASAYPNMMKLVPSGLVQGFLPKPYSLADLFQRISELLGHTAPLG